MINFNVPPFVGTEFKYMHEAVNNHKICGDGHLHKSVIGGWKNDLMQKGLCLPQADQLRLIWQLFFAA